MRLWGDNRGQAIQIGAVLLFATLIIALSFYQATAVPQNNKEVEFNHNLRVQAQLEDVRNAIIRSVSTGREQPVAVSLGTQYQERIWAVNPGPPVGTVQTKPLGSVTIKNAESSENPFWNGTTKSYETRQLRYQPGYNVYEVAPETVYEHSILFNEFDTGANTVLADQSIIDQRTISITLLDGRLNESSAGSVTLEPRPISVTTEAIPITDVNDNITLTLPTTMNQEQCKAQFENQLASNGGYVESVTCTEGSPGNVTLELTPGKTYSLHLSKVSLDDETPDPRPAYLMPVENTNVSITEGETLELVAQVRDEFNNPYTGQSVTAQIDPASDTPSGSLRNATDISGVNGEVRFVYEAPEIPNAVKGDKQITITVNGTDAKRTTFNVTVLDV